jgi:hypothetical protein
MRYGGYDDLRNQMMYVMIIDLAFMLSDFIMLYILLVRIYKRRLITIAISQ